MERTLVFLTAFASLGGFLYGYDLGLIGGALDQIRIAFGISKATRGLIVASAKAGAFFGVFIGAAAIHKYGRRATLALDSVFFTVGPLIMAAAPTSAVGVLIFGRLIVGVGIGVSAVAVPVYLAEMAPPSIRGTMVSTYELMLCLGMVAAVGVDTVIEALPNSWRWMVGAPLLPGLVLLLSLVLLPESPRWLVMRGDLQAALAALHTIMHSEILPAGIESSSKEVEEELLWLWSDVEQDRHSHALRRAAAARALRSPSPRRTPALHPPSVKSMQVLELPSNELLSAQLPSREASPVRACKPEQEGVNGSASEAGVDTHAELAPVGSSPTLVRDARAEGASVDANGAAESAQASRGRGDAGTHSGELGSPPGPANDDDGQRLLSGQAASSAPVAGGQGRGEGGGGAAADALEQSGVGLLSTPGAPRAGTVWGAGRSGAYAPLPLDAAAPHAGPAGAARLDEAAVRLEQAPLHDMDESFWRTLVHMIADMGGIFRGSERRAVHIAIVLAVCNQMMGSTAIINYAPTVFIDLHASSHAANVYASIITAVKLVGVVAGMALVDVAGRRPLLIWGSAGCTVGMAGLAAAIAGGSLPWAVLSSCVYILAMAASWAGTFWVLCSELFSMSIKSPATSVALAVFFASGAITNVIATYANAPTFAFFSAVSLFSLGYVWACVPETKGKSLLEVQALLRAPVL